MAEGEHAFRTKGRGVWRDHNGIRSMRHHPNLGCGKDSLTRSASSWFRCKGWCTKGGSPSSKWHTIASIAIGWRENSWGLCILNMHPYIYILCITYTNTNIYKYMYALLCIHVQANCLHLYIYIHMLDMMGSRLTIQKFQVDLLVMCSRESATWVSQPSTTGSYGDTDPR